MPRADLTFVILMAGLMAVLWELARPRLIIPGVLGTGAVAAASYFVCRHSPQIPGLLGLSAGALLFGLELIRDTHFAGGVLGTSALAYGFSCLLRQPGGIDYWLSIPLSVIFGLIAARLAGRARRARWNKLELSRSGKRTV